MPTLDSSTNVLLDEIEVLLARQRHSVLAGNAEALQVHAKELACRLNELSTSAIRSDLRPHRERLLAFQKAAYATGTLLGQRHAAAASAMQALNFDGAIRNTWSGTYASAGFLQPAAADPRSFGQA